MSDTTERAKALLAGITPGPWTRGREIDGSRAGRWTVVFAPYEGAGSVARRVVTVDQTRPHHDAEAEANVAFIADAPGLMAELVTELEQLQAGGAWVKSTTSSRPVT